MEDYEIIDIQSTSLCPICMDKQCRSKIKLSCNHTIHINCFTGLIDDWKNDTNYVGNFKCPSCKCDIKKEVFHCDHCKESVNSIKITYLESIICYSCMIKL